MHRNSRMISRMVFLDGNVAMVLGCRSLIDKIRGHQPLTLFSLSLQSAPMEPSIDSHSTRKDSARDAHLITFSNSDLNKISGLPPSNLPLLIHTLYHTCIILSPQYHSGYPLPLPPIYTLAQTSVVPIPRVAPPTIQLPSLLPLSVHSDSSSPLA